MGLCLPQRVRRITCNPHRVWLILRKQAADKLLKIWNAEDGQILHTLSGHTEGISDLAWSPDGEFLATASDDKTIRLWNIESVSSSILKTSVIARIVDIYMSFSRSQLSKS